MEYFGLKLGQELRNRAAHPYQEFRDKLVVVTLSAMPAFAVGNLGATNALQAKRSRNQLYIEVKKKIKSKDIKVIKIVTVWTGFLLLILRCLFQFFKPTKQFNQFTSAS